MIDEVPESYRTILIMNSYDINDLILPDKKDVKSSRDFRLKTLRKGTLTRLLISSNDTLLKNEYEFTA